MIYVIDNYDSFVYNIVQYLGEMGECVKVFRNDKISVQEIKKMQPRAIVLSPGPCTPDDAGICVEVAQTLGKDIPTMGVCLGHQSIAVAFGGTVKRAKQVVHGKVSNIFHSNKKIFQGLPDPFPATRYHSLIVEKESLPDCFEITSWTDDDLIMGISHKTYPIHGVQFHPESILTPEGKKLLKNFLDAA